MKQLIFILSLFFVFIDDASAQTQSWQWVKAGGSITDNNINTPMIAAKCKIGGCDAKGNIYGYGEINGNSTTVFDTFQSNGSYSAYGKNHILFSYDCSGTMRWAKQIGDNNGLPTGEFSGIATDINGNTYFGGVYVTGFMIGDSVIDGSNPGNYSTWLIKLDSLGKIVWVRNYGSPTTISVGSGCERCQGIRIGSSGNLWLGLTLDSNYAFDPGFHSVKKGNYQVEANPMTGNILGGYYTSNWTPESLYDFDEQYDIDENENYCETGTLYAAISGIGPGDTLYLNNHTYAPDSSLGLGQVYIYSLDKQGNFRYYITNTSKGTSQGYTCRYDLKNDRLITTLNVDSGDSFENDTAKFNFSEIYNFTGYGHSKGIYCIGPNGNNLWFKYITYGYGDISAVFANTPTANYISSTQTPCYEIFGQDSFLVGDTSNIYSSLYYRTIHKIDANGNLIASYTASLGSANIYNGDDVTSGAIDWRGNLYMGGSITNYMVLPNGDSVANTCPQSGNFFIAKIGISNCICPTPGTQFTQVVHGDTVTFYGSSANTMDSSIRWEMGDGTVITGDTFTYVYSHGGTYTVTAMSYNNCGTDSLSKQVAVATGISNIASAGTKAYPNPAKTSVYVQVSAAAKIGMIAANSTSMWDTPKEVGQSGTYVFDMGKYAAGLYYFLVEYSNGEVDVMPVTKE